MDQGAEEYQLEAAISKIFSSVSLCHVCMYVCVCMCVCVCVCVCRRQRGRW